MLGQFSVEYPVARGSSVPALDWITRCTLYVHIGVERHRRKLLLGTCNCSWEEKSDDFAGNTLVLA